jgi:hypothetical protein
MLNKRYPTVNFVCDPSIVKGGRLALPTLTSLAWVYSQDFTLIMKSTPEKCHCYCVYSVVSSSWSADVLIIKASLHETILCRMLGKKNSVKAPPSHSRFRPPSAVSSHSEALTSYKERRNNKREERKYLLWWRRCWSQKKGRQQNSLVQFKFFLPR